MICESKLAVKIIIAEQSIFNVNICVIRICYRELQFINFGRLACRGAFRQAKPVRNILCEYNKVAICRKQNC